MRTCLGLVLVTISACAAPPAPPAPLRAAPTPDVLLPADPIGPVVVIGSERITMDGKPLGSVRDIDRVGRLQKIDDLFEAMKGERAAWKPAHQGEIFPGVASLVVAPSTSGRVFASVFQTIAFAGFPKIRVAAAGRYSEINAQTPGPPCSDPERQCWTRNGGLVGGCREPGRPCPADKEHILQVQVEERSWRLRVIREVDPIDVSGEGPRGAVESFRTDASGIMSAAGIEAIIIHVVHDVSFARLAPFLAEVASLSRRAVLYEGVILSVHSMNERAGGPQNDRESSVHGRLPPEHIQQVVRANHAGMRKCYEAVLVRDPNATGKTSTRFVIGRDGKVAEARTTVSGNLPPEVGACVEMAFRGLTFQAPEGGIVTVTYPIVFSVSD